MSRVLQESDYRFFFFDNEEFESPYNYGDKEYVPTPTLFMRLSPHVYVEKGDKTAKFWLLPDAGLADNHGFSKKEIKDLLQIINQDHIAYLQGRRQNLRNIYIKGFASHRFFQQPSGADFGET